MYYVPFPRKVVQAVDYLIEFAKGNGSNTKRVETERDWETMAVIFTVWAKLYPKHYKVFLRSQERLKENAKNKFAWVGSGDFDFQHALEVPQKLFQMIKIIFPDQKWDKDFVSKFSRKMPVFKVPESNL